MVRRRLGLNGAGTLLTSRTRTRVGTNEAEAELGPVTHPMQLHIEMTDLSCSFTVHLSADNFASLAALLQAASAATYDATGSVLNLRPGDATVERLNFKGETEPITSNDACRKLLCDSPDVAGIRIVEVDPELSSMGPPDVLEEVRPITIRGRGKMPVTSYDLD